MNSKTLIAAAVASACAWPMLAAAVGSKAHSASYSGAYSAEVGAPHWEVVTPSSVDESAPGLTGENTRYTDARGATRSNAEMTYSYTTAAIPAEVETPYSVSETGPQLTPEEVRQSRPTMVYASLPNPQTPWSPNETGAVNFNQDMQERAEHVASVEQARIAAASIDTEAVASSELDSGMVVGGLGEFPGEPRDSEQLPEQTAGLIDSRQSALGGDLRPESEASEPASAGPSDFSGQQEFDQTGAAEMSSAESIAMSESESITVSESESITVSESESITVSESESITVSESESIIVSESESITVSESESGTMAAAETSIGASGTAQIESEAVAESSDLESVSLASSTELGGDTPEVDSVTLASSTDMTSDLPMAASGDAPIIDG